MKIRTRSCLRSLLALLLTSSLLAGAQAPTAQKPKITNATELPRFSYPMEEPPSKFLMSDDATFEKGADKSADGRRNLINPKATVALLNQRARTASH